MASTERTTENIEKLAKAVVKSWDLDTLIEKATDDLQDQYGADDELFVNDWEDMFGDPDE